MLGNGQNRTEFLSAEGLARSHRRSAQNALAGESRLSSRRQGRWEDGIEAVLVNQLHIGTQRLK